VTGPDAADSDALATAMEAAVHGYAMLLIDGTFGEGETAIRDCADRAARTVLAIIDGRAALRCGLDRWRPGWPGAWWGGAGRGIAPGCAMR
jgi:hypothetical protein